ncbi:hypothetical protein J6590_095051 [Homalodisca vitripennis]|nr:hypothetical protein J6590_095051 [Homalodisca vitripennis]
MDSDAHYWWQSDLWSSKISVTGWVAAERSCPCKQIACPAIGGGSEVTFKSLVPRAPSDDNYTKMDLVPKELPLDMATVLVDTSRMVVVNQPTGLDISS